MWRTDPAVNQTLARLLDGQRAALGDSLVGIYLFGSLVTGSFEPGSSDIDTVVLLRDDLTETTLAALSDLHAQIVRQSPEWTDRIEAVYLSTRALETSLSGSAPAARISPGEDFHVIGVDPLWILDWYRVLTVGIALEGPPIAELIPAIPREDYLKALRGHLLDPDWLARLDVAGSRCYAVITMCRGLRSIQIGDYVSKRDGAGWASDAMPQYASLIAAAMAWRLAAPDERDDATLAEPEVRALVLDIQRKVRSAS